MNDNKPIRVSLDLLKKLRESDSILEAIERDSELINTVITLFLDQKVKK